MKLKFSKKQAYLNDLILKENEPYISVLGSVQSGKTFSISLGTIRYADKLTEKYPNEKFNGAIIGWTVDTLKRNIYDVMVNDLKEIGYTEDNYKAVWTQNEKYIEIGNIKFYMFPFNNALSFNRILGAPLLFIWADEAARIYTSQQLQKPFDELIGRQVSYAGHPMMKNIHSFNVEGGNNHPYKVKYIDDGLYTQLIFFPWDNPKLDTPEKMLAVREMFPEGNLREQKIFNKWVVSEGLVFNKYNVLHDLKEWSIREIGIGIDYGSKNATAFVPIALALNKVKNRWGLIRLKTYYHDPRRLGTTPTTEFFSEQLRLFLVWLKREYPNVPVYDLVVDSEALHFINRLDADNIPNIGADKYPGSVKDGVESMQSLYYKEYLFELDSKSISYIHHDLTVDECGIDEALEEVKTYQYDTAKSLKTGIDSYKKEFDHSIDARRYLIQYWQSLNKCPTV